MNHIATSVAASPTRAPRGSNEMITEDHAALSFVEHYRDKLRFDHDVGKWFEFDGSIWRLNKTSIALHWARELARDLAKTAPDKIRYTTSKVAFAAGVERFARVDPTFAVTAEIWDFYPLLLGTPGGTVDLMSGQIRPPRREDFITRSTAVTPADRPDCPLWQHFIEETLGGDKALVRFLQQYFGYALTGDTREHALIFGFGPGGNGKGVTINTIRNILGDYAVTAAMDTFTAQFGERHSTDLAMLRGARLVTASETEEGRAWAESRIKSLTGGDPVTARFMRRDNFTFQPAFKLFIVGNHKPVLRNVDDAARRRFNIVSFNFKPLNPDKELEQKLLPEWPGILRWMIDGALDWQKHGLIRPAAVRDATQEYFDNQDLFGQWIEEQCTLEPNNEWRSAYSGELFSAWAAYAKAAGEPAGSKRSFSDQLKSRGCETKKGAHGARMIKGIGLRKQKSAWDD
jgi:putative DNA primase/helicase